MNQTEADLAKKVAGRLLIFAGIKVAIAVVTAKAAKRYWNG